MIFSSVLLAGENFIENTAIGNTSPVKISFLMICRYSNPMTALMLTRVITNAGHSSEGLTKNVNNQFPQQNLKHNNSIAIITEISRQKLCSQ